ncbi:MAG TPA: ABC transporter substrate-binding protein [Candidatus Paceibacterota bacterium]
MNKIIIAIVAVVVVGALAYFGFQRTNQSPTSGEPIKIGVVVYPSGGIFYVAQEKGLFAKYGVNAQPIEVSPDAAIQLLASNQIQMLFLTSDFMPIVADAGVEAKQIFSPSISYGADGMVVTKNVQSFSDLKGKKIYLGFGFPSDFLFHYVAEKNGLASSDFDIVNLGPEDVGASFVSGKIDAGMTWEPWLSKTIERKDGKVLFTSKDYPGVITDIVMARTDLIQNRRTDVENVMRAFFEASDWWTKNTTAGNAIAAKAFSLTPEDFAPMRDTVKFNDLQANLEKFDKSKPLNVYDIVEQASAVYRQEGVIKANVRGDSMTDSSLLNDIR